MKAAEAVGNRCFGVWPINRTLLLLLLLVHPFNDVAIYIVLLVLGTLQPWHFVLLGTTAIRKLKTSSINEKLEISEQWIEIRNGSEQTLRRNFGSPLRQSVRW